MVIKLGSFLYLHYSAQLFFNIFLLYWIHNFKITVIINVLLKMTDSNRQKLLQYTNPGHVLTEVCSKIIQYTD